MIINTQFPVAVCDSAHYNSFHALAQLMKRNNLQTKNTRSDFLLLSRSDAFETTVWQIWKIMLLDLNLLPTADFSMAVTSSHKTQ